MALIYEHVRRLTEINFIVLRLQLTLVYSCIVVSAFKSDKRLN